MTMRGWGRGVLKESKAQAKIIRNAARFLTGEARGRIVNNTTTHRTYNSRATSPSPGAPSPTSRTSTRWPTRSPRSPAASSVEKGCAWHNSETT